MATRSGPRSVTDATRFTSTTPHATSKHPLPPPSSRTAQTPGGPPQETPEQRVRRLRAAHLAAQNARVSKFDQVVGGSRKFFDGAQRLTILTLVGITLLAGIATTYSVVDMVRYNRKRRVEFKEAQLKIEEDELSAARLAFINGTATDDQLALVDEANAKAHKTGFKLPPLLGPMSPGAAQPTAANPAPAFNVPVRTKEVGTPAPPKVKTTWKEWWFSSLKREEEGDQYGSSQERLGWDSLSEEDDGVGCRESDLVRAIEDKKAFLKEKARAAVEKEKEAQRAGGVLDQVGLEKTAAAPPKKGWW